VNIKVEVTNEQIANLLVSAFEGGSNHWYEIVSKRKPTKMVTYCGVSAAQAMSSTTLGCSLIATGPTIFAHVDYPMNPGGSVTVVQHIEDEGPGRRVLNRKRLEEGLQELAASKEYRHHFVDILRDDTDATTGDVYLQFCLYGEVLYG
jgi:hypothetical protein